QRFSVSFHQKIVRVGFGFWRRAAPPARRKRDWNPQARPPWFPSNRGSPHESPRSGFGTRGSPPDRRSRGSAVRPEGNKASAVHLPRGGGRPRAGASLRRRTPHPDEAGGGEGVERASPLPGPGAPPARRVRRRLFKQDRH